MFSRHLKVSLAVAILGTFVAAAAAEAAPIPNPSPSPVPLCSDPGRSCSVDRNCCSGSCRKGSCD